MKIAKIIATSFFPRTVRKETILAGNPPHIVSIVKILLQMKKLKIYCY